MGELPAPQAQAAMHEVYRRVGATTGAVYEAAAQAFAVAELLVTKGLVGIEELDRARRGAERRLAASYDAAGLTVQLTEEPADKYAMEDGAAIDCAARLPSCQAACCRLRFALSEQDIHEGVVQWDIRQPYVNRQRADGYCAHSDEVDRSCQVYAHRPAVCRAYDCRQDARIWADFEAGVVNPGLAEELARVDEPVRMLPSRTGGG
ncbi:MAG TPA: YkgJ family cysteine cluster protein [Acidimicrobiales bacterium]|nr:YkgJ family cysteine cluster protein [Acidimicrobiales bacterium]